MNTVHRGALRLAWFLLVAGCQDPPAVSAPDGADEAATVDDVEALEDAFNDAGPPDVARDVRDTRSSLDAAHATDAPTSEDGSPPDLTTDVRGVAIEDRAVVTDLPDDAATDGDATTDGPTMPARPSWHPPPLSGGTLALARDGVTAIVSDPDTDRVLVVDLVRHVVTATFALATGDEPGRAVEDDHRRAHVVLRGGGAIVAIDLDALTMGERRAVCSIPRGIAWDPSADLLHVACAGGELVTLPAGGGPVTRIVQLDRDLRDVVVQGNRLLVTRFRAAETLVIDETGAVTQRIAAGSNDTAPATAWRAVPAPGGGVWLLHQRGGSGPVSLTASGSYSASRFVPCTGTGAIVRPGLVRVHPPYLSTPLPDVPGAALAVDLAVSPSGATIVMAIPGNLGSARPQVIEVSTVPSSSPSCLGTSSLPPPPSGQVVAVAYTLTGQVVVQTRAPGAVVLLATGESVSLGGPPTDHAGHRLFHTNPTGLLTCASCHAEGDDDGRVWTFNPTGPRRTQYLRGGVMSSAPFHWNGDQPDFNALIAEVMVRRMSAPAPEASQIDSLSQWIDALPVRPRPSADRAAAARGEALFRSEALGCSGCHSGPRYSSGETVDVGTGGRFQVPTLLGLAWRAPYLHDGRAATLRDRFVMGGGDMHGHTSTLTPAQIDDLVAFLETL